MSPIQRTFCIPPPFDEDGKSNNINFFIQPMAQEQEYWINIKGSFLYDESYRKEFKNCLNSKEAQHDYLILEKFKYTKEDEDQVFSEAKNYLENLIRSYSITHNIKFSDLNIDSYL